MDKLPEDFGPLQGCSTSPRLVLEGWQREVGAQTVPPFPNGNTAASSSLLLPALRGHAGVGSPRAPGERCWGHSTTGRSSHGPVPCPQGLQ